MADSAISYDYIYPYSSELIAEENGERLRLAASKIEDKFPYFFEGEIHFCNGSTPVRKDNLHVFVFQDIELFLTWGSRRVHVKAEGREILKCFKVEMSRVRRL